MATTKKGIAAKLSAIQVSLKVPKRHYNNYGKYKYRKLDDILEEVKPIAGDNGCVITLSDEAKQVGDYVYIQATATIRDFDGSRSGKKWRDAITPSIWFSLNLCAKSCALWVAWD